MIDKNKRRDDAKNMRSFWTCARPVTQVVPNKKAYNRKRIKDTEAKLKAEGNGE